MVIKPKRTKEQIKWPAFTFGKKWKINDHYSRPTIVPSSTTDI